MLTHLRPQLLSCKASSKQKDSLLKLKDPKKSRRNSLALFSLANGVERDLRMICFLLILWHINCFVNVNILHNTANPTFAISIKYVRAL